MRRPAGHGEHALSTQRTMNTSKRETATADDEPELLATLATRQLLVVTGKGGVGKTTVAVALGQRLAAAGKRVLVLEVDPRENAHRMLGVPPSGGAIAAVGP